jgi:hypothetical protein
LPSAGSGASCCPIGTSASACPRRHLLTGWPWRLVEASCTLRPALCTSPCSVTSLARPSAGQSFDGAGGIRTHGLELMRLARTAAPLPRVVVKGLAGRSRTCGLRFPKPAGWPAPLQPEVDRRVPPAGLEPAASGLRARRHRHFDRGGLAFSRGGVSADADSQPCAQSSGGRARTCALAGNNRASFQLDHAGTERRQQDSNLRAALRPPTR